MNKLLLSKEIYKAPSINETISAFSKIAKISLYESVDHYICIFENCLYSQNQTMKEFENYLIDLCNQLER